MEKENICDTFLKIEYELSEHLEKIPFSAPVQYVYNPLEYAKELHVTFVKENLKFPEKKIMFLGMNPGPWGMCQTGIPFGDSKIVTEWFSLRGVVGHPKNEHPLRKVMGVECKRRELSGTKFWGLFKGICLTPDKFFKHCIVYNICPLAFLAKSGRNVTPAEIKASDCRKINKLCDEAFVKILKLLKIELVIAVGKFAEKRASVTVKENKIDNVQISSIPHPSPRNVKEYSHWETITIKKLHELNIFHYFSK